MQWMNTMATCELQPTSTITYTIPVSFTQSQHRKPTIVYVLNQNLTTIGSLEGIAQGENLHAVRFMGERAYIVTFIKTDPLFVIDLSLPTNPKVLGQLTMPGYSDYLHPYDATHLIGVGKEAVDSKPGQFRMVPGLKTSLCLMSAM